MTQSHVPFLFLLSHVPCFVSVLLSQVPCSVSVSLTPFLLKPCCAQVALSPFLLSHVHCFVSALRRSYVVSVSRCSCSLMLPCVLSISSASRCSSHVLCFVSRFVSASRRSYAMPCLVSACYHTITPLFSALPFSGYSIMTIISYHVDRLRIAS